MCVNSGNTLCYLIAFQKNVAITITVEPLNDGCIRDRSLVFCREVVPISEVGIDQTRSLTTLRLAQRRPQAFLSGCACGPNHAIGCLLA